MRTSTTRRPRADTARSLVIGVMAALSVGCGGPAVPSEVPASSPLAPTAESAPLPRIGSSFEDTPISEAEEASGHAGHAGHGTHAGHAMPADEGHADHGTPPPDEHDAGPADAGPAPHHHHGAHGHAH